MHEVGRLKRVWRYPVKSMRGQAVESAWVDYNGLVGDRVWMCQPRDHGRLDAELSVAKRAALLLFQAHLPTLTGNAVAYPAADQFKAMVITPNGETVGVEDPLCAALVERRFGSSVAFTFSERSFHDQRPLSLFFMPIWRKMKTQIGQPIDQLRFRANLYLDWDNTDGLLLESLLGQALRVGSEVEILINKMMLPDKIAAYNPATAARDSQLVHSLNQLYPKGIGVYAVVLRPGCIKPGDSVQVLD